MATVSWSNVEIPRLICTPFFNVGNLEKLRITDLNFSGQRGNDFSISESVLFFISIFKEGCQD